MTPDDSRPRRTDDRSGGRGAATETTTGPARPAPAEQDPMPADPIGTLFIMILFLLLLVGLWGTVFWMLLDR